MALSAWPAQAGRQVPLGRPALALPELLGPALTLPELLRPELLPPELLPPALALPQLFPAPLRLRGLRTPPLAQPQGAASAATGSGGGPLTAGAEAYWVASV